MRSLRRAVRWVVRQFTTPLPQKVPRWWLHCPICDEHLVGPYPSGAIVPGPIGPTIMEPTRDELIAKCPTHGHPPYNDATRFPGFRQIPDD